MIDSPRRSPRISARTSLEAQNKQPSPAPSPLSARPAGRQNQQQWQPSSSPSQAIRKPRASTSSLQPSATIAKSASPNNNNDTGSPARKNASGTKLARRAYSVGGPLRQQHPSRGPIEAVPSRKNVPGPRKSAIRALPPQVFRSPTELSPPPSIRPLFSRRSLGLEAFGGADLMNLMQSIGIIKGQRETQEKLESPEISRETPAKTDVMASTSEVKQDEIKVEEDDVTLARKRRRVTFNPYQEKANFEKDEPTMRIRPASEADLVPESADDDVSTSTSASSASSDMSIDEESSSDEEESVEGQENDNDDSESEAEVEEQINATVTNDMEVELQNDTRQSESETSMDMTTPFGDSSQSHNALDDGDTTERENDSAMDMDMTAAYGGMQDPTMTGIAHGFSHDDDSDSAEETDSQGDTSSHIDDMTVTMQLTEVHGSQSQDTTHLQHIVPRVSISPIVPVNKRVSLPSSTLNRSQRQDLTLSASPRKPLSPRKSIHGAALSSSTSPAKSAVMQDTIRRQSVSPRKPISPRKSIHADGLTMPSLVTFGTQPMHTAARASLRKSASVNCEGLFRSSSSSVHGNDRMTEIQRPPSPSPPLRSSVARSGSPERVLTSPQRAAPLSPARASRPSSPLRTPGSPSRAWDSFRTFAQNEPSSPKSPARRISMPTSSFATPSGQRLTFGSPQRVAKPATPSATNGSPQRNEVPSRDGGGARSLNAASTPGRASRAATALSPAAVNMPADSSATEDRWTMKRFFDSLDLGFLDLTVPSKRRIVCSEEEKEAIAATAPTNDALVRAACATVPALDGLIDACQELRASVGDGRVMLAELEREFYDNPPSYVAEVLAMGTSSERQQAISSFKLQKSAARAIALKAYYGWRTDKQFDDAALQQMQRTRDGLQHDVERLRQTADAMHSTQLPILRAHSANLLDKLTRARARQGEIEAWDADEMAAMHAAMQEQSAMLDEQQATHVEARDQLHRLKARLEELESRTAATQEAIATARASSDAIRGSTHAEAARLARHVEHVETLHMWSLQQASAQTMSIVLDDELSMTMHLYAESDTAGCVEAVTLELLHHQQRTDVVKSLACDALQFHLTQQCRKRQGRGATMRPADVVRFAGVAWTRARHVADAFARLGVHYPTDVYLSTVGATQTDDGVRSVVVSTSILFERLRTKVVLRASCSVDVLLDARRPLFMPEQIGTERVYGHTSVASALSARVCDTLLAAAGGQGSKVQQTPTSFDLASAICNATAMIEQ